MDLSSLLDRMLDLFFLIQPNGEILYVSSYTKKLLGFEADELLGMKIYDILEERTRGNFHFHLQSLLEKQRVRTLESCEQIFYGQCQRKDQSTFWVEMKGQAWQKGNKVEFVMVMREMVPGAFYQRVPRFLPEEEHKDLQQRNIEEGELKQEFSEMKNTFSEPDKFSNDPRQSQSRGRTKQKDNDLWSSQTLATRECLASQDSFPSPIITPDVSRLKDVQVFEGSSKNQKYRMPPRKGLPIPWLPREAFANVHKSNNPENLKSDSLQTKPSSSAQDFTPVSRKRLMHKRGDSTVLASQAYIKDFSGRVPNLSPMEMRKNTKEAKTSIGRTPLVDEMLLKAKYRLQDSTPISRKRQMSKQEAPPSPESSLMGSSDPIDCSSPMKERKTAIESESRATSGLTPLVDEMLSLKEKLELNKRKLLQRVVKFKDDIARSEIASTEAMERACKMIVQRVEQIVPEDDQTGNCVFFLAE